LRDVPLAYLDLSQLQDQLASTIHTLKFRTIDKVGVQQWSALVKWVYRQPTIKLYLETITYRLELTNRKNHYPLSYLWISRPQKYVVFVYPFSEVLISFPNFLPVAKLSNSINFQSIFT